MDDKIFYFENETNGDKTRIFNEAEQCLEFKYAKLNEW